MNNNVYINTAQNVTIDYNLADIGKRVLAKILDNLFIGIYFIILYAIFIAILVNNESLFRNFFDSVSDEVAVSITVLIIFILMAPPFFYSLYFPYFMQGRTPGKAIMKIKIVNLDGSEAGFGTYFVRWLLNIIDFDMPFVGAIVGLVVMASNSKRQRIADLVAKTVVISTQQKIKIDQTVLSQLSEDYQPKFGQVLQLSDKDVRIISQSLSRARNSMDYSMTGVIRKKIEDVIHEYRPEMSDIEYIETVLKDYQYFSQE
ncbi:MAG: RDD family protein [Flavobacteriaceae bacterium]|jgi:uncharacterized RDD family membrane protein YckC|nr:RDD family protein [Flavobacteriaceae bacterium]